MNKIILSLISGLFFICSASAETIKDVKATGEYYYSSFNTNKTDACKFAKEQAKINNIIKKNDLILTGAYGPPIPIDDVNLIEVHSSLFGNVSANFK